MSGNKFLLHTTVILLITAVFVKAQQSSRTLPAQNVINPVVISTVAVDQSCTLSEPSEPLEISLQNSPCGGPGWRQVSDLDMTRVSDQCPSTWVEVLTPARSCRSSSGGRCEGVSYNVSGAAPYSRVCGRATGYALGSPDAFGSVRFGPFIIFSRPRNVNGAYLDGMSVTHGSPRQHIWSFAASGGSGSGANCHCNGGPSPPSFVGLNYFCDVPANGALWDGKDCTATCCAFNSPPYFSVSLPTPTSNDIEVRLCADQGFNDEAVHLSLLQLFVQ